VDTLLGLIGLVLFSVCIVVLAAATTWVVVKLSPAQGAKRRSDTSS
jgi:hypothetical protein